MANMNTMKIGDIEHEMSSYFNDMDIEKINYINQDNAIVFISGKVNEVGGEWGVKAYGIVQIARSIFNGKLHLVASCDEDSSGLASSCWDEIAIDIYKSRALAEEKYEKFVQKINSTK